MNNYNNICIITHKDKEGRESILSCHIDKVSAFSTLMSDWSTDGSYSAATEDGYRVRTLGAYIEEKLGINLLSYSSLLLYGNPLDKEVHRQINICA